MDIKPYVRLLTLFNIDQLVEADLLLRKGFESLGRINTNILLTASLKFPNVYGPILCIRSVLGNQ